MKRALAITLTVALAACAAPGSLAGHTEAELRAAMGAPAAEYRGADGSRTLAYPTGRMGTQTYMAEVAPDGRVRAMREALNNATFNAIQVGMSRDEVLRMIGPPGDSMQFRRQGRDSWEYLFVDDWGYRAYFYVDFDASGAVVSKTIRRIEGDRSGKD